MLPYIIVCCITMLLAYIADTHYGKNVTCWTCLGVIILLNTFFAGLRDFGVGIDTTIYVQMYFDVAREFFITSFFSYDTDLDKGFLLLAKLATWFSDDSQCLLVITELFIISLITIGVYSYKKELDISFAFFYCLFFLIHYCESLNLMRQFCAIAVLFLGLSCFIKGKWSLYILAVIVAYSFHSSSLVFNIVPLTYYVSENVKGWARYLYVIMIIFAIVAVMVAYYYILTLIGDFGIFKEDYLERYGVGSRYESESDISFSLLLSPSFIIPRILPIMIAFMGRDSSCISKNRFFFFIVCLLVAILANNAYFIMQYFARFSFYYSIIYILYFSVIFKGNGFIKGGRVIYLLYLSYAWYMQNFVYMMENLNWNYEYRSVILGI